MASNTGPKPQRGRLDKRQAVLEGALAVFARDGYSRASIDAIAAEAGVSTRTIYNHFADKADLFQSVIQQSAAHAAGAQIEVIERYLRKVTDLEADLVDFGRAMSTPIPETAQHFALVRQINAEIGHVPQEAIDAWQETGPLRVRRELARRLQQLVDRALLKIEDPERAALHLMLLVATPSASHLGATPSDAEITDGVTAGVRVFLRGYGTP